MSREDVETALVELALDFEAGGDAIWTSRQVADALRRRAVNRYAVLTNRRKDDEQDDAADHREADEGPPQGDAE